MRLSHAPYSANLRKLRRRLRDSLHCTKSVNWGIRYRRGQRFISYEEAAEVDPAAWEKLRAS